MNDLQQIKKELSILADPKKSRSFSKFFKTGSGQYGYGDVFAGISVPDQRKVAKKSASLSLTHLKQLLSSKIHEHRLTSLFILSYKYECADDAEKNNLISFYLKNVRHVNNWDLVDHSAVALLGKHVLKVPHASAVLYGFARSDNVWQRRISIVATLPLIRAGEFDDALQISQLLLCDEHDLIHKAVGWILREIGKQNRRVLEAFLNVHLTMLPRTTLRYAIECLPEKKRLSYLHRY